MVLKQYVLRKLEEPVEPVRRRRRTTWSWRSPPTTTRRGGRVGGGPLAGEQNESFDDETDDDTEEDTDPPGEGTAASTAPPGANRRTRRVASEPVRSGDDPMTPTGTADRLTDHEARALALGQPSSVVAIAVIALAATLATGWSPKLGLDLDGGLAVVYQTAHPVDQGRAGHHRHHPR